MNYYPYFSMPYTTIPVARTGLRSLFGNIKWGSILSGTQKTLGIVNQAIPLVKQAKPVINNAKTMFRVMNEFKRVDTPNFNNTPNNTVSETVNEVKTQKEEVIDTNGPVFFA